MTLIKCNPLKRVHSCQQLWSAVSNGRIAVEIIREILQARNLLRGGVGGIAAVHEGQGFELLAVSDVTISRIRNIHGHQFFQRWECRKRRDADIPSVER